MICLQETGTMYELRIEGLDATTLCLWQQSLLQAVSALAAEDQNGPHVQNLCLLLSELSWEPGQIGAEAAKPRRGMTQ